MLDPAVDLQLAAEQKAELRTVLQDMQILPEADRAALLMRAEEGMTYEEIARSLGLSLVAVKVKIHRARQTLAHLRNNRRELQ
jgi:RNA polymerase sigma-70 factor (ECF subfamily)